MAYPEKNSVTTKTNMTTSMKTTPEQPTATQPNVRVLLPNSQHPFTGLLLGENTTHMCIAHNRLRPDLGEWIARGFCTILL